MDEEIVKEKYNEVKGTDYEKVRWFSNNVAKGMYEMTKESIRRHTLQKTGSFQHYLEVGPGPGTWTKLFIEKYPKAEYDLVDISREMLGLAKNNLPESSQINFYEKNFSNFIGDEKYDFFFSSRALEYFSNKEKIIKKITSLLKEGGDGFIITKTPKYWANKLLRRKTNSFHSGQICWQELVSLLEKNGCTISGVYPVTVSFPFLKSARLSRLLFKVLSPLPMNFLSDIFSESYCVKFVKK
ncbi:MAG: class I SAM-dependent methyltransferase [Candidatus Paceibacterota bacterium]